MQIRIETPQALAVFPSKSNGPASSAAVHAIESNPCVCKSWSERVKIGLLRCRHGYRLTRLRIR